MNDSIRSVAAAAPSGTVSPHTPFVSRSTLKTAELNATMDFEVALKMRDFAAFQARIAAGDRLSPQEMAAKYQPLAADYEKLLTWLTAQGFQITYQDSSHIGIFARGTVAQIQQAFQMKLSRVQVDNQEYTAAVTAPNLPAALAPLVVGINGLQPYLRPHKHLISRPASLSGTNPPYLPSQIAQAYSATPLYNFSINGTGQTIAIVIDTFPNTSDLVSFWQTCSINQSINNVAFIKVVSGGTYPAASGEETLDVEWSSSIAPGANVRVYGTTSLNSVYLDEAYAEIYSDLTSNPSLNIHEMSMSYGGGESTTTQSQVNTDDSYFSELAAKGVSIFASSGDGGSTPNTTSGIPGDESGPLQVEAPADDPYVTGVGGTSLVLDSSGNESGETVWNNSSGAGGGGASGYTSRRRTVSFARPSWQTGTGVPSGSTRLVPDLAGPADPDYGGLVILTPAGGSQTQYQYGGTSWASPTVAGFCALLNQAMSEAGKAAIGNLNTSIYSLIGTPAFRDITSGTNATANSDGLYAATTGYDETTGVGVPLVQALAQALTGATTPQITTQPVAQVITIGQPVTFSATATGTAPLAYKWLQNGTPISGATNSSYTVDTSSSSTGAYSVVVSNPYGSVTSSPADFVAAVSQPMSQTVTTGTSATLSISVSNTGGPFSYQWLFNGSPISGATASSYTIPNVSSANQGSYAVTITDAYGTVTTSAITLTVSPASLTDTPALPPWALLALGMVLCLVAGGPLVRQHQAG